MTDSTTQHTPATFDNLTPKYGFQWCPGCGNFGVLNTLKFAIVQENMDPSQIMLVSDIGQAGKIPMWLNVYGFHGLHGRALPLAQGMKIANPMLRVVVVAGDGGAYAEGGGHYIAACRRNVDLTYLVHDNSVYALTTGQVSPTSQRGSKTPTTPDGSLEPDLNPLQVAIASGATFVARAFAGDQEHFQQVFTAAMKHPGFAVVDILQPCVIWNKVQTWQSWEKRVVRIPATHNVKDKHAAFKLAESQWSEKIPIGILYQERRPTFEEQVGRSIDLPLTQRDLDAVEIDPVLRQLMGHG
jgi:2-oxoglutarate ferredoxin oxidoreductase subunit beta